LTQNTSFHFKHHKNKIVYAEPEKHANAELNKHSSSRTAYMWAHIIVHSWQVV